MSYPIIVLDGPDGTGKSTLANAIAETSTPRGKVLHLTARWLSKMPVYHLAAWRCAELWSQHQPVILDRWHLSERVYAGAYRGGTKWPLLSSMLDSLAKSRSCLTIIALPQEKEVYLRHFRALRKTRTEMYNSGEERVYDGYHAELYNTYKDDTSIYRYDIIRYPNDVQYWASFYLRQANVRHHSNMVARKKTQLLDERNFAGAFSASVLFVGDITNAYRPDLSYPFFDVKFGPASVMLHRMFAGGIPELFPTYWAAVNSSVVVIRNGVTAILTERLNALVDNMPLLTKVIALGNSASNILSRLEINHVKVPHPSAAVRFGGTLDVSVAGYKAAIKEALAK